MNVESFYSYVMSSTWFFLIGWVIVLLAACLAAFRQDWSGRTPLEKPELGTAGPRYAVHSMSRGH